MSFLSRISLANRSLVALATIAILIFGAVVIPSLKQELYPTLEFPAVTVTTSYLGASPSIVEQNVTDPLEQSIQGLQDIQQITSYSNQGYSVILVSYNFGVDLNQASQQITQQISHIQGNLPSGVTPQVQTFSINSLPIIQVAATSNENQARFAADLKARVVPALSGIDGVAQVNVTGVRDPIVLITASTANLAADGVSLLSLIGPQGVLASNNITLPAGQVTNNGQTFAISVGNQFNSIDELKNLPVMGTKTTPTCTQAQIAAAGANAAIQCKPKSVPYQYKLSDVAKVEQTLAPSTSLTRTNGQPSLGIAITKTADGNTVNISQAVRDKLSSLEGQFGNGTKFTVISDQAPTITSAVTGLVREGLIGAAFAILIILLFLFSMRSTLVTAVSIPLSIIIALIALSIGKLSLNLFTLGAMTIAVGRVVDDSIVVLENIHRHLGLGEEKKDAVLTAVKEVAGAVTASTLTTVAVFLPIAFTGGFVGEVFGPFAVTVTVALLASLLVALMVIPVLAYWFLKAPRSKAGAQAAELHEKQTFLERSYVPMVRWATGHKAIALVVAAALFIGSIALTPLLGTNFFSSSQQNTYSITQTLPVGTSRDVTDQAAQQVENVLQSMKSTIQNYQVTIGASGGLSSLQGATGGSNSATFSIMTDPNADQSAFQSDLQKRLNALSSVGTLHLSVSSGGGFNSSGVSVDIQASDQATLEAATQQVLDAFKKVSDITNISSNLAAAAPLINVQVDPTRAAAYNLSAATIGQTLRLFYSGSTIMTVNFNGQQENVNFQMTSTPPTTVEALQNLILSATPTGYVTLGDVAKVSQTLGPTQITHVGGQRTATVSATATTNNVGSVTAAIDKQIKALHLPAGATIVASGEAQQQSQAFTSLGQALLFAILLVYVVMVATFRSLVQPLILLVSIPFAATGSLVLMLVTRTQLGVPSLIGLLMLIGIVVTNAIVLLDLVRQYRKQGMDARTAVIEGGRRRLRPILMTAIATILALMPMALGLSKDSGFIAAPLAITVIGGLTSSTILTLLLVPTLYVLIEGGKDRKNVAGGSPDSQRLAPATSIEEQDISKQVAAQSI